jgi:hypothetical protein
MKTPPRNDYDYFDRIDLKYVQLTKIPLICDICGESKPVISNGIMWLLNPYKDDPPEGFIDIQKLAESAENTPLNEEDESGSINPQEGV